MKRSIDKKFFLHFMVYMSILMSVTSTWVTNVLHTPLLINQVFTAMIYLPFALLIFIKLVKDAKECRSILKKPIECIYYLFALYYTMLTGYRLLNGMEIKENLYYSVVFFGAIAFYLLIRSKKNKIPKSDFVANLVLADIFFLFYRLIYCLVGVHFIERPPVNVNITSGVVAMLTPFVGNWLINECSSKREKVLYWLVLCGNIVTVLTTGARAIFYLLIAIIGLLFVCSLNNKKGFLRVASSVLAGCLIITILAMTNTGNVRYSIYRQTGLTINAANIFDSKVEKPSSSTENPSGSTEKPVDPQKELAEEKKYHSDSMRKALVQLGIDQIKLNPMFGTGDVTYEYQLGDYKAVQSSHNFLIETLICYGAVGLLIIAALFIALVVDTKLFARSIWVAWKQKVVLVLTILFYFAFGFVQPIVFSPIICPLFVFSVAMCRETVLEEYVENNN